MTTVKTSVRNHLKSYPQFFGSRTSVLHQVLCSIGGGYSWVKGQAIYHSKFVPWDGITPEERWRELSGDKFEIIKLLHKKEFNADMEEYLKAKHVVDNVNTLSLLITDTIVDKFYTQFYQQTDHALLMNVPDDVTPDWAKACEEIKILALKNGWVF